MVATVRAIRERTRKASPRDVTLLELVQAVSDVTLDEREVTATVIHMLQSGTVRLCGCFRDVPIEDLFRHELANCACVDEPKTLARASSS